MCASPSESLTSLCLMICAPVQFGWNTVQLAMFGYRPSIWKKVCLSVWSIQFEFAFLVKAEYAA